MEWKETARWIKFEENVEDSNRWGKPHVASLTFHSLLELRKGLEKGITELQFDFSTMLFSTVFNPIPSSHRALHFLLLLHPHPSKFLSHGVRLLPTKEQMGIGMGTMGIAFGPSPPRNLLCYV